jgi:hypothetical protein
LKKKERQKTGRKKKTRKKERKNEIAFGLKE